MPDTRYSELPCADCIVRSTGLCAAVPDTDMHRLYGLATEQFFDPGEMIIHQEQPADFIFSIRTGYAVLFRLTADGKRQIFAFLFPGNLFGLTSEVNYHWGVSTISAVEVCRFDRDKLEALIDEFPQMDRNLRLTLTRIMDSAFEMQFSLGRKDATQKVASFIWYIGYRQKKLEQPGGPIYLPMRRADIADFLGLTIETVSRTFTTLTEMGVINLHGTQDIEIIDLQRLKSIGVVMV